MPSKAPERSTPHPQDGVGFLPFREQEFLYFEQVRLLRQSEHSSVTRATLLTLAETIIHRLEQLGAQTQHYLQELRDDLKLTTSYSSNRLPRQLFVTLTREEFPPSHDAALYIALRDEGLEMGFGFGIRKAPDPFPVLEKYISQFQRFHRKSGNYVESLLQRDYKLWTEPFQPFATPSESVGDWLHQPGVIVRTLDRSEMSSAGQTLPTLVGQVMGELIGWYGFLDRLYTKVPHVRPLLIESFEDPTSLPPEDDIYDGHSALQSLLLDFQQYARSHQLDFSLNVIRAYYLALQTRPFVILSGAAGTGKSKLALLFARFLALDTEYEEGNPHVAFLPVRPDWLDPQPLLGYYDTLAHTYRSTPFLNVLLRAHHDPDSPYFVILDEMNLARVEYYMADVLSLLESRVYSADGELNQVSLHLHSQSEPLSIEDRFGEWLELPGQLPIPANLYLTGTVNIDETTHRLSPKVLDRANLIEMTSPSPASYLHNLYLQPSPYADHRSPAMISRQRDAFCRNGTFTAPYKPEQLTLRPELMVELASSLEIIVKVVTDAGFAVGMRTIQEVVDFGENLARLNEPHPPDLAWWLDHQLLQKVLPRLNGSRQQLERPLAQLLLLCWPQRLEPDFRRELLEVEGFPLEPQPFVRRALRTHRPFQHDEEFPAPDLPLSARKLAEMLTTFQHQPYVDFHLLT
ncbi:MAG: hypothetical protein EP343_09970 [Deltaproteobacteria bacterium]|nr:MAG: hypothetical protein EP343_09970 [Deltaproteobacteria bacterium]